MTKTVYVDRVVVVYPEDELLTPVDKPSIQGRTNTDLLQYVNDLIGALKEANAKLGKIREEKQAYKATNP